MKPIGFMRSPFKFKNGTPRQPTVCSHARGFITIEKSIFNNPEHSLEGLEHFSHIWVLFLFHKNNNVYTKAKVKPPRLNGEKVGLFSTRSPYRPNAVGLTLARVEEVKGASVYVSGIDILDGTPVVDIKPYIPQYDCPEQWPIASDHKSSGQSPLMSSKSQGFDKSDRGIPQENVNRVTSPSSTVIEGKNCSKTLPGVGPAVVSNSSTVQNVHDAEMLDSFRTPVSEVDKAGMLPIDVVEHSLTGVSSAVDSVGDQDSTSSASSVAVTNTCTSNTGSSGLVTHCGENSTEPVEDSGSSSSGPSVSSTVGTCLSSSIVNEKEQVRDTADRLTETVTSASLGNAVPTLLTDSSPQSDRRTADWIDKPPVNKLNVRFTLSAEEQLSQFSSCDSTDTPHRLQFLKDGREAREAIHTILREDPRSTYRRKQCVDSLYYFTVDVLHVTCWFDDSLVEVVRVKPASLVQQCQEAF